MGSFAALDPRTDFREEAPKCSANSQGWMVAAGQGHGSGSPDIFRHRPDFAKARLQQGNIARFPRCAAAIRSAPGACDHRSAGILAPIFATSQSDCDWWILARAIG